MNCLDVRERLTEHALGLLPRPDAHEVERHLDWCAGCRKEASELLEGAAAVGLALPPADPPTSLEGRIVERMHVARGERKAPSRVRVRILAVATLAASILAAGAFGWAIAERGKLQSLEDRVRAADEFIERYARLTTTVVEGVPDSGAKTTTYIGALSPPEGGQGGGSVFVSSHPSTLDVLFVRVALPPGAVGPFVVQLVDGNRVLRAGQLGQPASPDGDWTLFSLTGYDLSDVLSVTILDSNTGGMVLTGRLAAFSGR